MSEYDVYRGDPRTDQRTKWQLADDALDYRRSLYTNTKADHPANWLTGEPCGCERGDDSAWERHGFHSGGPFVPGPLQPEHDPCGHVRSAQPEPPVRQPVKPRKRGRSR